MRLSKTEERDLETAKNRIQEGVDALDLLVNNLADQYQEKEKEADDLSENADQLTQRIKELENQLIEANAEIERLARQIGIP